MSAADNKRFRVVVVGVADGHEMSPRDLAGSLTEYFPLAPDAQVAIESGRSAVVQVAESEHVARKAATMLIKLGAEIRIEPDSGSPLSGGPLDFDDISFDELDEGLGALEQEDSLAPVKAAPVIVDQPPPVDEDAETLPPQPSVRRRRERPTRELEPVETAATRPSMAPRAAAPAGTQDRSPQAGEPDGAEPDAPPPTDAADDAAVSRGQRVRCPAHGLWYNPTESPGCSRCLGPSAEAPFRLAPELRKRPRLWLTLGLALGLLIGAVPAALYAQDVKSGALYERRIEADAILRTRAHSKHFKQQYAKARAKITATRNRGIAIAALIWIGIAAALMLLWYRFV